MKGIIDFHTHAFDESIARKAIPILEKEGGIKARLDGTVKSLVDSMDKYGVEKSVVCSIATKPSQFSPILNWSEKIQSDRIIPLPSVHPEDPYALEHIAEIKAAGFRGIKMHPYYQDFNLNDTALFKIYEKIAGENLFLLMHTGFDFAFERVRKADPEKIREVTEKFPELKLVLTHMGAWEDWDAFEKLLCGKKIYMEISFSLQFMRDEQAKRILDTHPEDYILFGSDSPWTSQGETIDLFKKLSLKENLEQLILRRNALKLLGLSGTQKSG